MFADQRAEAAQPGQGVLHGVERLRRKYRQRQDLLAVPVGRQERQWRRLAQHRPHRHIIGQRRHQRAVLRQHLPGLGQRKHHQAGGHFGADRVQGEFEGGDDAEIAATPADRPEQVGIVVGIDMQAGAVGGDEVGREQVVDGHAVQAAEPAEAAAQGQAGHPGGGVDAQRGGQAIRLRFMVEVAQGGAAFDPGAAPRRVDAHRAHGRQVDHQAIVGQRAAGDVVAAAAHRQRQALAPGFGDGGRHVGGAGAAHDQRRALVDHGVPYLARLVVVGVAGCDHAAAQA